MQNVCSFYMQKYIFFDYNLHFSEMSNKYTHCDYIIEKYEEVFDLINSFVFPLN